MRDCKFTCTCKGVIQFKEGTSIPVAKLGNVVADTHGTLLNDDVDADDDDIGALARTPNVGDDVGALMRALEIDDDDVGRIDTAR